MRDRERKSIEKLNITKYKVAERKRGGADFSLRKTEREKRSCVLKLGFLLPKQQNVRYSDFYATKRAGTSEQTSHYRPSKLIWAAKMHWGPTKLIWRFCFSVKTSGFWGIGGKDYIYKVYRKQLKFLNIEFEIALMIDFFCFNPIILLCIRV
jgi:hypothetical protein